MKRTLDLRLWLLLALIVTCIVNLPSLMPLVRDGRTDTAMILSTQRDDEMRYVSRVRDVMEGHLLMGNPITKEYQNRKVINGLVEWFTAGYGTLLHLNLAETLLQTDVLFTFLNVLLMFLWLSAILRNRLLAIAAFVVIMINLIGLGEGILRESHPKSTMLLVNLYLCLVFIPAASSIWLRAIRGFLIGLMVYSYPYHWTVLLPFEVLMLVYDSVRMKRWKDRVTSACAVFLPFTLLTIPLIVLSMRFASEHPLAWNDTLFRFGLILTHGIVAPVLQAKLWAALLALGMCLTVFEKARTQERILLFLLVFACSVAVASNIITGKESEFEGHYGRFVLIFAYAGMFSMGSLLLSKKFMQRVAILTITLGCILHVSSVKKSLQNAEISVQQFDTSDEKKALEWISKNTPKDSVILAPIVLSLLIPSYTDDYVFLSRATHFFQSTDEEILKRYLVFITFFPEEADTIESGSPTVFGNYAGVAYARAKSWYRITHPFGAPFQKTIPDFILHQELRRIIDERIDAPDYQEIIKTLESLTLDFLVTKEPIPAPLRKFFRERARAGSFILYERS